MTRYIVIQEITAKISDWLFSLRYLLAHIANGVTFDVYLPTILNGTSPSARERSVTASLRCKSIL